MQRKATVFTPLPRRKIYAALVHPNAVQSITEMLRIKPSHADSKLMSAFERNAAGRHCAIAYT